MSFAVLLLFAGLFAFPWTVAGLIYPPAAGMRNASRWKILGYGIAASVLLLGTAGSMLERGAATTNAEILLFVLWFLSLFVWPVAALVARIKTPSQRDVRLEPQETAALQVAAEQDARPEPVPAQPERPLEATVDDPLARLHPETVQERTISFVYRDSAGDVSWRKVDVSEIGAAHFSGFCHKRLDTRTFRFDRIVGTVTLESSGEAVMPQKLRDLLRGYGGQQLRQKKRAAAQTAMEILFTGFPKDRRAELEALATSAGMVVRKTVTANLHLLCIGTNAGPSKIADAQQRGVMLLDETQFRHLLETGEVPA